MRAISRALARFYQDDVPAGFLRFFYWPLRDVLAVGEKGNNCECACRLLAALTLTTTCLAIPILILHFLISVLWHFTEH